MLLSDAMAQPATRTKGIPRRQTAHKRPQESGMSSSLEDCAQRVVRGLDLREARVTGHRY
jgi:hypothetical protein